MSGDGGGGGGGSSGGGGKGGKGGGSGGGFTPPSSGGGGGALPGDSAVPPTQVSGGGGGGGVLPGDSPSTGGGGDVFGSGTGSNTLGGGVSNDPLSTGSPAGTSSFDESGFNSTFNSSGSPTSPLASITNPTGATSPSLGAGPGAGGAPGLPGVGDSSKSSSGGGGNANQSQGSSDSILKSLGIINPLGTAVALGGLGSAVAQGNQPVAFTPEMTAQAHNLDANGQKLMSYLQSGTLPPGLQASVDTAKQSARAQIISNFAARGMPVDPAHNSALASALAQADTQATINIATIGQQLLNSGVQESQLASTLYTNLAKIDQTQQQQVGQAIANVSAALSRGTGGTGTNNSLIKIG